MLFHSQDSAPVLIAAVHPEAFMLHPQGSFVCTFLY